MRSGSTPQLGRMLTHPTDRRLPVLDTFEGGCFVDTFDPILRRDRDHAALRQRACLLVELPWMSSGPSATEEKHYGRALVGFLESLADGRYVELESGLLRRLVNRLVGQQLHPARIFPLLQRGNLPSS